MTGIEKEPTAIIFRCKECSGIVFEVVNVEETLKGWAKEIAGMLRDGYKMQEISREAVRNESWCDCKKSKQESLPLEQP